MKAMVFDAPGDEVVLHPRDVDSPVPAANEVRIAVEATAINRADLLQRLGKYPPPKGASEILGLECSGTIAELGSDVSGWNVGERVMALLPGGGYAEEAVVDAGSLMPMPESMSFEEAAAVPEVFLTAFLNIFLIGEAKRESRVLVHGGSGGVGTAAILLCREAGAPVWVTAGTAEKCDRCGELGAKPINYRTEQFEDVIIRETAGRGVDVILDPIGGSYLSRDLACLAVDGTIVVIASMGGRESMLDMSKVLGKRARIIGSTLRNRTVERKAATVRALLEQFGPALEEGRLRPIVDRVLPLQSAAEAHRLMNEGSHFGKIVLKVRDA